MFFLRYTVLANLPSLFLAFLAYCCLATPRDGSSHEAIAVALIAFAYKVYQVPAPELLQHQTAQPQPQPTTPKE